MLTASVFRKGIVRIAKHPPLAGVRGSDDRMTAAPRVLAGVLVGGAVAAVRAAALLACAQVDPSRADFHALVALAPVGGFDVPDLVDVTARSVAHAAGLSSAARSHFPSVAARSYVVSTNATSAASGSAAVRTAS